MKKQNQWIIISFLICNFFIAISASQKLERTVKFPERNILIDRLTQATSFPSLFLRMHIVKQERLHRSIFYKK